MILTFLILVSGGCHGHRHKARRVVHHMPDRSWTMRTDSDEWLLYSESGTSSSSLTSPRTASDVRSNPSASTPVRSATFSPGGYWVRTSPPSASSLKEAEEEEETVEVDDAGNPPESAEEASEAMADEASEASESSESSSDGGSADGGDGGGGGDGGD